MQNAGPKADINVHAIEIERLGPQHLQAAHQLSQQAGWPHRHEDWAFVLSLSHGLAAIYEGKLVGTAMASLLHESVATINMVIVDESMRGQGLGRRLMNEALAAIGNRECRLVATQDGLPLYEKLGFQAIGTVMQHQGAAVSVEKPEHVEWLDTVDLSELAALDAAAFGAKREGLFIALGASARFAALRKGHEIAGFAALRPFGRGQVIGPVVAENADDARALITFLLAQNTGAFMRVDTLLEAGIGDFLTSCGLVHVGGGVPMVRGLKTTSPGPFKTFALTSQALG